MNDKKYKKDINIRQIYPQDFPYLLNEIPDKPKSLYVCGNTDIFNKSTQKPETKFLCVVGSRKYSSYGYDACVKLISSLKGKPVVIVSGLALGIDGIAHRTALDNGLTCVAVPGSGLDPDILYPRAHVGLAKDIVEHNGVLISEYEPLLRACPWSFPMRNRIMAGLSHAVLIIEGEHDSGTLITARLALDYNRDVLALPGSIFSDTSQGPLSLIKRGAVPICNEKDLAEALGFSEEPKGGTLSLNLNHNLNLSSDHNVNLELKDSTLQKEKYRHCSEEELSVLSILSEAQSRDDILQIMSLPLGKLQIVLSMLEIRGLIIEEYGLIRLT